MKTQAEAAAALVAFDYESITVSNTVIGLSAAKVQPANGRAALAARISVETTYIRWRSDGGDPVATSAGHLNYDSSAAPLMDIWLYGTENVKNFRAIRELGSDAVIRVTYYR
jgi:hypothetical protein